LELALRAIQYGSKEGKDLVVQIYNDKNFDNYNKSLVKYVEKLEFQFNA
jgi:FKBP-type peptidyl-prolyl cis-trans isomerase 2